MKLHAAIFMFTLVIGGDLLAAELPRVEFYDVQGNSGIDVLQSMNQHGPVGKDGIRYHGHTSWQVKWTYHLGYKGKSCEIQSLVIEPSGTMILPKWNRPDGASKNLKQEWDRYAAALREHESGHYDFAISASKEIEQRLSSLNGAAGCHALREEIDREARAVLSEFLAKELAYDATSKHGATHGARFFP
jgi:predicted secreted Zn-dependent protease